MSLIITTYVREGIVLTSDSRLSLSSANQSVKNITQSDSVRKTFVTNNSVGISTCGQADIGGVPIAGFVDSFIQEEIGSLDLNVQEISEKLLEYFKAIKPDLKTIFHIVGYDTVQKNKREIRKQRIFRCYIDTNKIQDREKESTGPGSIFDGYNLAVAKLINPVYIQNKEGKPGDFIPFNGIAFNFFNLQDAIDFNRFALEATINLLRFEMIDKIVGGAVDILVITPESHNWVQQKELK